MNDFGELSVNIKGNNTYGSGLLYQYDDDNAFVITAKHCIYDEKTELTYTGLEITDYKKENLEIVGMPIYSKNLNLDLATIKVKIKNNYPALLVADPKINQRIVLFGYPVHMETSSDNGTPLRGEITQIDKPNIFKIVMDKELSSSFNTEFDNVRGYSGSGIYLEYDGKCHLVGIVTTLENGGKHGIIKGVHINNISGFFENEVGIKLLPSSLVNFSDYLDDIIKELDDIEGQKNKLIYLIEECYSQNFTDITPKIIHDNLNKYLIHPYQETFDYTNRLLWVGWLEILLYKSLQSNFNFNVNDFFKFSNQDKSLSGIHMLFTNSGTLENFVGSLFRSELYDKIDDNDVLFVNNQKQRFMGDLLARKSQIEGIVLNIDHPQVSKRLSIDDPQEQKLFPIVHLQYLEDEIVRFLYKTKTLTAREFSIEFPKKLNQIFEEIEK